MQQLLEQFLMPTPLSLTDYERGFTAIFEQTLNECQIASLLTAIKMKSDQAVSLLAGARIMRRLSLGLDLPKPLQKGMVDNCGTGGDGQSTFNISTGSAIVAACVGAKMAKHGNRSVSSKCGSADLLFEAGFPVDLTQPQTIRLLEEKGFTFFYAPSFHPEMKKVMPIRKALGIRTIFNFLGPLINPIRPDYQLLGVGHQSYHYPMADALRQLGVKKAAVVHSEDGLDEISPAAPTKLYLVENGAISEHTIRPEDYITKVTLEQIRGGDSKTNYKILQKLLDNDHTPVREAIILNTGACLWVCNLAKDLNDGCELARSAIESGRARSYFDDLIKTANTLRGE